MNKQELAASVWDSANGMRSKIEANEYKDYILGLLFYKFLSDKVVNYMRNRGVENPEELKELLSEDDSKTVESVQRSLGYFISYDNLFSTWVEAGRDFDISSLRDALKAFSRLINPDFEDIYGGIFNTLDVGISKLGENARSQTRAVKDLIHNVKRIPTDGKQGYDVLGYIYEYLISNFAANAGKKAGEFYTPHEVSLVMSEILADHLKGRGSIKIYDPTSGSGSLLLNIGGSVAKYMKNPDAIRYYAQELKENTYNLTRMNLVMHNINPSNIETRNADTLEEDWPRSNGSTAVDGPETLLVDAVVSNPPYSQHWNPQEYEHDRRYQGYGLAPKTKADYAFLLHDLYHLKSDGVMAIVLPHGVLFRGGEEGAIRKNLIESGNIDTIIGLPPNIFFGTGISTIVMILKKNRGDDAPVLFVDASRGFRKDGNQNLLRAKDVKRIVDTVISRSDHENYSRNVSRDEIRGNGYNLNIPRYVDSSDPAETWDVHSLMFGGVPASEIDALEPFWGALPGLREYIFDTAENGYSAVQENHEHIIETHPSVVAFKNLYEAAFDGFQEGLTDRLIGGRDYQASPNGENELTAEVFDRLERVPLVDKYDAYQLVHDQWQTIAGDLEILQLEGEEALRRVDPNLVSKKVKGVDTEIQDGWVGRIIPFDLAQEHLLAQQTQELAELTTRIVEVEGEVDEILASFSDDDKEELAEVLNEAKTAFSVAPLRRAVREAEPNMPEGGWDEDSLEHAMVRALNLLTEKASLSRTTKALATQLHEETRETIENLSDEQVDQMLTAKWVTPIVDGITALPTAVLDEFTAKIAALASKYATTAPELEEQISQAENSLGTLVAGLNGSQTDIEALQQFQTLLGGE